MATKARPIAKGRAPVKDARPAKARGKVKDGFLNQPASLGLNAQNITSAGTYDLNPITRQRTTLEYMYRGSWVIGVGVDSIAEDMTKEGVDFVGDEDPAILQKLDRALTLTGFWASLCSWIKWARLYGGAVAVMLIDGQDVESPLDLDTIRPGQFKGFYVYDRWQLNTAYTGGADMVTELGPNLGKPSFYQPIAQAPGYTPTVYNGKRIHYSRCLRMEGLELPYFQRVAEAGWGLSVVERVYDRLQAFDSTTTGAAQLVYRSYLRTLKVTGLRKIIAAGGDALTALEANLSMIKALQTSEGLTVVDGMDDFQTHQYAFPGLAEMMLQFGQQIAGAFQVPIVRLFGESPNGMSATGESDFRTYYDGIGARQEKQREQIGRALDVLYRSVIGRPPPPNFGFTYRTLWKISNTEKSSIAGQMSATIVSVKEAGIISQKMALQELKQTASLTGVWTNITSEDIDAADDEPPSPDEGVEEDPTKPDAKKPPTAAIKPDSYQGKPDVRDAVAPGKIEAAGVLFLTPDRRGLFLKRSSEGDREGLWALPGGKIEDGETPESAARRECGEEIGQGPGWAMSPLRNDDTDRVLYKTFLVRTDEFTPVLNNEHTGWQWVDLASPPAPLHPGVSRLLEGMGF